jgi:hypothetical protein
MGEFWFNDGGPWGLIMAQHFHFADSVRTAASAARIYGKSRVAAEALTIADGTRQSPGDWKTALDAQFCTGLNDTMIHLWSHQHDVNARPGLFTYDAINANMTWWEQSPAFLDYIARCQSLLRHGRFVADFCYFFGEDTACFVPGRKQVQPALPAGCDFDGINAEVILSRLSCKDGRPVLPDGQAYRYLVVPSVPGWNVTLPVLRKLSKFVRDGMTVIGAKPGGPPGLRETAKEIRQRQEIIEALWGGDVAGKLNRRVGKGRVISGDSLAGILAADRVSSDVAPTGTASPGWESVDWIHRRSNDADIYFLANSSSNVVRQTIAFRVAGRQPELWNPLTGTRRALPEFLSTNGCSTVPLKFEPNGSAFVVFRGQIRKQVGSVQSAGQVNFPELKPVQEITGPWAVQFDPRWGGPDKPVTFSRLSDWKDHADPKIKFFSGTAVYRNTFSLPPSDQISPSPIFLDLGAVKDVAEVRLNGKLLGTLWCAPWRVEITDAVMNGTNTLEITVANLWNNRMVGDAALPADQRVTRSNAVRKPDDPLLASGLLGPVTLHCQTE